MDVAIVAEFCWPYPHTWPSATHLSSGDIRQMAVSYERSTCWSLIAGWIAGSCMGDHGHWMQATKGVDGRAISHETKPLRRRPRPGSNSWDGNWDRSRPNPWDQYFGLTQADSEILVLRPVWSRNFNISGGLACRLWPSTSTLSSGV